MKKINLIVVFIFTLFPIVGFAFTNEETCCEKKGCNTLQKSGTTVTKGYYSIGNNSQKLSNKNVISKCCKNGNTLGKTKRKTFTKGYYAIGDHAERQAPDSNILVNNGKTKRVTKGYYSIGNNQSKLNKGVGFSENYCSCCGK